MRTLARMKRLTTGPDGTHRSSMASEFDTAEEGTLIGTPDEVIERRLALHETGVRYVLLAGVLGDAPASSACSTSTSCPPWPVPRWCA